MRWLAPLAAIYGAALALPEACARAGIARRWAMPLPVVSIGNLTVGGNAKTPLVLWLIERLAAQNLAPGVALRGYAGSYTERCEIVSDPHAPHAAARWGDEACLIARRHPEVPVAVARERALAVLELHARRSIRVAILDDGFQHRRLRRDLDIVLLDTQAPFGNGRLLPAGVLREPPRALRRAHVVVLSRWDESPEPARRAAQELVRALQPGAALAHCSLRCAGFRSDTEDSVESQRLAREGLVGFCGIARPRSFRNLLRQAGAEPRLLRAFGDHHPFSALELEGLEAQADRLDALWLVTTEKDAARLGSWRPRRKRLAVLRVELEVEPEEAVLGPVRALCAPAMTP